MGRFMKTEPIISSFERILSLSSFGGLCGYVFHWNTDREPGDEWRGAERRELAGYMASIC